MHCFLRGSIALAVAVNFIGCIDPKDQRPGILLRGEVVSEIPVDWSFTNAYREIQIEVRTPYLVSHSVTIWCAVVDGQLYLGARNPHEKRWPGWVERDPNIRLRIDGNLYDMKLTIIEAPSQVAPVRRAYADKYELPDRSPEEGPPVRYWRVERRS